MELISDLKHWVLAWGDSPWGSLALFVLAFWESSFFPIPPDGLMIALAAGNLPFALGFSGLATAGSLLGAMLGYWIGLRGGRPVLNRFFSAKRIHYVEQQYQKRDIWAVTIAAFTPIPYKVFAIGAGAFRLNFRRFMLASLIGRGGRFFLVGILITVFGTQIETIVDDYFDVLAIAFVVMLVMGVLVIRFVTRSPASSGASESE
ncbi:MAG: cytochrome B [Chloroflexi bacterium]|nr:cytochrome B [Chloroflexota bacterium]HCU72630.1 cytochrome B [Chloroflexota bacterium]